MALAEIMKGGSSSNRVGLIIAWPVGCSLKGGLYEEVRSGAYWNYALDEGYSCFLPCAFWRAS
jgi:hypothetical protein